jgi:large subunit ribosomal protein L10
MASVKGEPKQWKLQAVEEIKQIFTSYPVIGIVGFRGVTAGQMQEIRRDFRDFALLKVTKNSLVEKALNSLEGDFAKLRDYLEDQTAIVATNLNPFKLYKKLEKTKVPSYLKPGQISPVDVVVEKCITPFPPGPVIGELQMAGLPAAIEKGKIVIKETVTVVRSGEVVRPEVARAIEKLEIKPVKVGLEVKAIYEKGVILTPDTLAIDIEMIFKEFMEAHRKALNLAVNAAYVTPETAEILITKACMDAKNLAINAGVFERDIMAELIAKSYYEMLSLASMLPSEALDDELIALKAKKVEEKEKKEKEEEKKEEEEEEVKEEEAIEGLGALFG